MNNRSGLGLLLIASLWLGSPTASAQSPHLKESHRMLLDEPDMNAGPEMMADRLKELRELHQLQDRVRDLLKDPDFRKNLTSNFSVDQLRQLQEKILKGDGLGRDANWNKLLDQAVSGHKLDERQIDILRRWAERSDSQRTIKPVEHGSLSGRPQPVSSPSSSSSSGPDASLTNADPSFWGRLQGETTDWIAKHMDGIAGDVFDTMDELGATEEGAPLAELMRSLNRADFAGGGFTEDAAGLSSHLPDLSEFGQGQGGFWDELRSLFGEMRGPSLPDVGRSPSLPPLPSAPSGDGDAWGGGLVALLSLGILFLLLWKGGGWSRLKAAHGAAGEWRLGPWPVSPAAVATRRDLIRAFEYLALLRLGTSAGTRHHRDLADRLAEQGSGEPARRQAAEMLAWLYELARYAPADESLSPDELIEARHALCFLAGVTAA